VSIKGMGGKISSSSGNVVTVGDCLSIYEPKLLRWLFASYRPNTEFAISFDLDALRIYDEYDRAVALAHEPEDGGKKDKKRVTARRSLDLSDPTGERIVPGTTPPFQPPFRPLSMILQIYDGDLARTRAHYETTGELQTERERELFDVRARCVWNWIEQHAPADFCYRIRNEPVVRELDEPQRVVLTRLVAALEQNPNARDADLVPHMKALFEGLELTAEQFFPVIYDLLLDRPKGPKLTTLLTVMGAARALPLLRPSLTA
jgi:lysyl-tRNA synthetase class 1